jgi:hypothetical protein
MSKLVKKTSASPARLAIYFPFHSDFKVVNMLLAHLGKKIARGYFIWCSYIHVFSERICQFKFLYAKVKGNRDKHLFQK